MPAVIRPAGTSADGPASIATRQSLLDRLKNPADDQSWKLFFDTYWRLIYNTALKAGLTDTEAQEAVQETMISVSKSMPNFQYDPAKGSFKVWLMRLTGWRIKRQFQRRTSVRLAASGNSLATGAPMPPRGGDSGGEAPEDGTELVERIADPAVPQLEALWEAEWEQNLLEAAVERVRSRADPKQFQIFDYCVVKQLPIGRVARALRVNRGLIYLARHRVGRLVQQEVARLRARSG